MHIKLDYITAVAFLIVQARISVLLWRRYRTQAARIALVAADIILACCFVLSYSEVISRLGLNPQVALVAGAVGLGYLMVATVVLVLYTALAWAKRLVLKPEMDPGRRRVLDMAGVAMVATPIAGLGYGTFIQRTNFTVREVDLPVHDLQPGLDGVTIAQISDIHLSAFLTEREFARVIDEANGLHPQLFAIIGDLISSRGDPLDACLRQLARLKSDAGTFGCLGNHERYAGAEGYTTAAGARLGIQFLRNRNRTLEFGGSRLNLVGVDYESIRRDRDAYLLGADILKVPGAFNLLLSHNPDVFPQASALGFNLQLSGHTHGGQVTIEILDQSINPARFITPYVAGLYRDGASAAYVTRGVGTIGIPTRLGAPPEITLLRLRKA